MRHQILKWLVVLCSFLAGACSGSGYSVSGPAAVSWPSPSPCPTAAPGTYTSGPLVVKATELCGVVK